MTQPERWFLDEHVHQVGDEAGEQQRERERCNPTEHERDAAGVERLYGWNDEVIDDWYVHQVNSVTERCEMAKDRSRKDARDEAIAVQK